MKHGSEFIINSMSSFLLHCVISFILFPMCISVLLASEATLLWNPINLKAEHLRGHVSLCHADVQFVLAPN